MSTVSNEDAKHIFEQMCAAALAGDDESLCRLYETAKTRGIGFTIVATSTRAKFKNDCALACTEVEQDLTLFLGEHPVANWTETIWGYYGSMGTGWWIERGDSTLSQPGVADLLEMLELQLPDADVPQPPGESEETEAD